MQKLFYKKVGAGRGGKKKKKKTAEEVIEKHSGILGLCAFVNAFPYDVPDFVPDILMVLSDHLHDPQPIPVIRKKKPIFRPCNQDRVVSSSIYIVRYYVVCRPNESCRNDRYIK